MKKNGFTLVELLAVIVILGVVITLGTTAIGSLRIGIDQKALQNRIVDILSVAKQYGNDNRSKLTESVNIRGTSRKGITKTVSDLINNDYLATDEKKDNQKVVTNNVNGKVMNDLKIIIYLESQRVYACIVNDASSESIFEDSNIAEYGDQNNYCLNF